ncbi:APC family permease [Sulfurisphaera tokodaii]|uniref:APC family transporter n=2 Tax=Sulfurisphaera tokodaii TaxID=111955 RepID=Q96XN6_SULTO|nr:APC family permease [Sulfurisphaera tokodaii]BAB67591.1 putative APC family transporter [Sulfurisphaera tokodaii str. 7]HII74591.1 APC family permease [Sulfurisphaera tokodaii]
MEKSHLFIRESSGLIKQVNFLDVIMLNIGNMSAGLALFTSITPYVQPGSNLLIATLIGFLFALPQAYIYTYFVTKIPRTGGDYVWISRILNGGIGTVMALSLMIESLAYFALTAFFASSAIQTVFSEIGTLNSNHGLVNMGNILTQPIYSFILGFVIFAIIIAINIVRAKWGYSLISILGIVSLSTTIIAMGIILANTSDFVTRSSEIISALGGSVASYSGPSFSWAATLFMLPFLALYTFPWMQAGPAIAAEIKGKNSLKYNVFISLILTFIIVIAGYGVMYYAGGYNFVTAQYINNGFIFTFWTAAIGLASNEVLQWIIGIGLIAWEVFILAYGAIVFSRYIFAMAFDRVLPSILTNVTKNGSPIFTHLLDLFATGFFLGVIVFIGSQNALALYGATVLGALYFLVVSIAGIVHGIKNNVIKLIPIGVITAGYFSYLTYVSATNPDFGFVNSNGAPNPITLAFVIGTLVFSTAVFIASYVYNKKRGVDLNMIYKEIPPE